MTTFIESDSKTAGRWTKEEHQKFLYGLKLYGKNWKKIQDLIETRTSTQIRSHAQKFFIKMKKLQQDQSDSEIMDHSFPSKHNQQTLIPQHDDKFLEKQTSIFSFYFEQIAKNFFTSEKNGQEFNFWNSLIESPELNKHKSCEILLVPEFDIEMRKINSLSDYSNQEIVQSCQLIRTEHSSFEAYKV